MVKMACHCHGCGRTQDFSEEGQQRERKVRLNKRLLISPPDVMCPGSIKDVPFLLRSDEVNLPVCLLLFFCACDA